MVPPLRVTRMSACATIGSPRFTMTMKQECAAQKSGLAAGFLSAWHKHGVDAVSQVRGAYAVVIVDASKKIRFSGR